jgi:hypothetical protein
MLRPLFNPQMEESLDDIIQALQKEASTLEHRLSQVRQAIGALTGRALSGQGHAALSGPGHGGSKLKGRKLSAAHIKAIREGIAKRKARKHGAGKAKER